MFAQANVKQSGNSLHVEHGTDSNLYVEFEMVSMPQPFESEKAGRPIFKDVPHIKILFPGDRTKQIFRPINEDDKMRFPRHYQAFLNQETQVQEGTPITEWPPLTKSEAQELKGINIHTVEALAGMPDTALTWFGAREKRDRAKAFLAASKDSSAITKLMSENERLRTDLEAMKNQINELATPKKRGPKPSEE